MAWANEFPHRRRTILVEILLNNGMVIARTSMPGETKTLEAKRNNSQRCRELGKYRNFSPLTFCCKSTETKIAAMRSVPTALLLSLSLWRRNRTVIQPDGNHKMKPSSISAVNRIQIVLVTCPSVDRFRCASCTDYDLGKCKIASAFVNFRARSRAPLNLRRARLIRPSFRTDPALSLRWAIAERYWIGEGLEVAP